MGMMRGTFKAILVGGFVAGTIDIGAACLISGLDPVFICKYIAGGLLGKAALSGGYDIAALGLVLQWVMSWIIAAVYVFAATVLPVLKRQWIVLGLLYGVGVYFVMNYVVVPLSAWQRWPKWNPVSFGENMAAMLVFGLIVAWFAHRTLRDERT